MKNVLIHVFPQDLFVHSNIDDIVNLCTKAQKILSVFNGDPFVIGFCLLSSCKCACHYLLTGSEGYRVLH